MKELAGVLWKNGGTVHLPACLPSCHLDQQHEDSSLLCPSGPVQTCALDGNVLTQGNPDTSPPSSWQTNSPDGFYKNPQLKTRFIRLLTLSPPQSAYFPQGARAPGFLPGHVTISCPHASACTPGVSFVIIYAQTSGLHLHEQSSRTCGDQMFLHPISEKFPHQTKLL